MLCGECGADNPKGARLCGDCGAALAAQSATALALSDGASAGRDGNAAGGAVKAATAAAPPPLANPAAITTLTVGPLESTSTTRAAERDWNKDEIPASVSSQPGGVRPAARDASRPKTPFLYAVLGMALVAGALVFMFSSQIDKNQPVGSGGAPPGDDGARPKKPAPPPGMIYVPGGELLMGREDGDEYERPQHKVRVRPFFIDLYEVTCEEYKKFIDATKRRAPPGWANGQYPPGATRRPVTGVTWDDASEYAAWAGKRLPTEMEWEFAARGSDGRRYPWGNEWRPSFANADTSAIGHMADVGAYKSGASPYGAFDMIGNAWEWTASNLTAYPGGELPKIHWSGDLKIIRGGCWKSTRREATTTYRRGWPARGASTYEDTGFRCAKDIVLPDPN